MFSVAGRSDTWGSRSDNEVDVIAVLCERFFVPAVRGPYWCHLSCQAGSAEQPLEEALLAST